MKHPLLTKAIVIYIENPKKYEEQILFISKIKILTYISSF